MKALHRWLFLAVALWGILPASAHDFQVDGIYYQINGEEVAVVSGNKIYSGTVIIPPSVSYIGNSYSVTSIGSNAFLGCSGLTSITIPESVESIGEYAFYSCSGLTSITIPNSVTSIGEYAFYSCSGLTSITIPESVTSIGSSAFSGCSGLTSVTIPESVTSIGSSAFNQCSGLTSITIPNSVTSIENAAFEGCSGLTSVTIPESVTSIGSSAFWGCSGLKSVAIGESVESIGAYAFSECSSLTSVTIPESVTSLGKYVFSNCSGLKSVVIGGSVEGIGNGAFSSCSSLTSVTIPESVTTLGRAAFTSCSGLTSVTWNARACITIDEYSSPFLGNNIETFIFGDKVEQIPAHLCDGFTGLTSVTIPNSVTSIGDYAFRYCSGLTSVAIGESVESIGAYAFSECSSLTSVTIGESVKSIGELAFAGCNRLESATIYALNPPEIWANTFDDYGMPLYVPAGSKEKYQAAKYWRNFTNIQETGVAQYTVELYSSDESMGTVMGGGEYDEGTAVTLIAIPASGYHFVQWSDGNTDNPRQIIVTEDVSLTAEFSASCKLSVSSNDDTLGGVTAVLTATPKEGCRFVRWSDGNTDNPRTVFVTETIDLVAEFMGSTGIVEVAGQDKHIYVVDRTLHVENNEGAYQVYTAAGQLVYTGRDTTHGRWGSKGSGEIIPLLGSSFSGAGGRFLLLPPFFAFLHIPYL